MNSDCSIVILSFNTKDITHECLKRVGVAKDYCQARLGNEVEVIVVENGSSDGSGKMIRQRYPWVKLIEPGENTGFAKGNNLGLKAASKPFILLLNSDAYLKKETLVKALNYFAVHPDCGVLACRLNYADGKLQPSAGYLPRPASIVLWWLGVDLLRFLPLKRIHPKDPAFFATDRLVEWATGAFLFLKRGVYEKTKGFDERFFMYMEEVEWCRRIKEAGFKLIYTPSFNIVHLGKASSQFDITQSLVKEVQGLVYYLKKYSPASLWYVKTVIWLGSILRMVAFSVLGKHARASAYKEILRSL